jgi:peptidoglycan/LPS O-acetylase OafA/YrhL
VTVPRRERILELDGLRAIAILAVFLHHALHVPVAWAGVDVFFVLSGFLITGILLDAKQETGGDKRTYFGQFYARRARRILPPYYVALIFASLAFGWGWLHRWYWFVFFGTNIGESMRRSHLSLQPLWSLAVEEQFYMVWPWVVLLASERWLKRIAVATLVLAPALRWLCTPLFRNHFPIYFLTPFRADLLCAGALLALTWRHNPKWAKEKTAWALGALVAVLATLLWANRYSSWHATSNTRVANTFLYELTLIGSVGLLVLALSGKGWLGAVLRWRPVRYVGMISYTMYLVHLTCLELVRRWTAGGRMSNRWLVMMAAFLMTLGFASAAWYGWERRILRLGSGQKPMKTGKVAAEAT